MWLLPSCFPCCLWFYTCFSKKNLRAKFFKELDFFSSVISVPMDLLREPTPPPIISLMICWWFYGWPFFSMESFNRSLNLENNIKPLSLDILFHEKGSSPLLKDIFLSIFYTFFNFFYFSILLILHLRYFRLGVGNYQIVLSWIFKA